MSHPFFPELPDADRRSYSHLNEKDPKCLYVDPAVITCYPTNQTVAYQNQYTRVICEYPSSFSPTPLAQGLCAFGISFTLRAAAGSSLCMWPPKLCYHPTSGVPYASPIHCSLAFTGPPTRPNLDTSQTHPDRKLNSASRHSSTITVHLIALSSTLPVLTCYPRDPRPRREHRIYLAQPLNGRLTPSSLLPSRLALLHY